MALMAAMTPEEKAALMQAPASPAFAAVQHPMHAMIAPIGPPPPEIDSTMMTPGYETAQENNAAMSATSPKQPKVTTMSPLERYEEKQGARLMSDMQKDENPYGSPNNHPGVLGKILHGLSVATGGPNRRAMEEAGLSKGLNENENEVAKRGLEGAQTENLGATAEHTRAETPEVAPNAESQRALQQVETQEKQQALNQGPSLASAYAHRVNEVLKSGGDPSQDPIVQHLQDAITALQPEKAAKEPQRDDKAIAINMKPPAQRTPEEVAYLKAYDHYVQQNKTDPGIARAIAFGLNRPVQVVGENGDLNYETSGQAMRTHAAAPGSIGFSTEKGVTKEFTTGTSAKNITAYNTAIAHLGMLDQAAAALHNGDTQVINRIGNEFAAQTGSPAPTNFEAVKDAVAGEVSKTFKGGQATDTEIQQMNHAINAAQSPAQLSGVIKTFTGLMNSKRDALKQQYEQGLKAKPNFEESPNSPKVLKFNPSTGRLE